MKKIAVILLALQLVSGGNFLRELLKLPALVQHYSEAREHGGQSLTEFLSLHYNHSRHTEDFHREHAALPLQSDMVWASFFTYHEQPSVLIREIRSHRKKSPIPAEESHTLGGVQFGVFQPPRA